MSRILVLVEGQTERALIDRVINPFLSTQGSYLYPRIIGKPEHKGGVREFSVVLKELKNLLHQEPQSFITTFFDYYPLPNDWPGVIEAKSRPTKEIPAIIESSMADVVTKEFSSSFNPARFIPYIQMHELEALLFAGPKEMADAFGKLELETKFQQIVQDCGGCEKINDNYTTSPSHRIESLYPRYRKGATDLAHAPIIADRIGLERIRRSCPHFNEWIGKLENLPAT